MGVRVLLADPEEMLLEAYQGFLSRRGFEVETAASGPVCVAKLHSWKPDILVLEPEMPNGWGERILAEVARTDASERASVLILTRSEQSTIPHPACALHLKPLSMVDLVDSIRAATQCRWRSRST